MNALKSFSLLSSQLAPTYRCRPLKNVASGFLNLHLALNMPLTGKLFPASLLRCVPPGMTGCGLFHTSAISPKSFKSPVEALDGPQLWPAYNSVVLPPQHPNEPRRPAQCFHMRTQIRHSEHKLWYAAMMIRGMSIEEALKQLAFNPKKACKIIREVLLEAQEIALRDHNFEFKSKMWVAESFTGKGTCVKGIRRCAKGRIGHIKYNFHHYFVKLEEGDPPAVFNDHPCNNFNVKGAMTHYIEKQRKRFVWNSL